MASEFVLNSLGLQIKEHWKTHRPKMAADLERTGQLEQAVYAAQELTLQAEAEAIRSGMNPYEAREIVRTWWAFLPDEAEVPDLANGDPWEWRPPE